MGSNKRLGYAFVASLLFNGACVATVGMAALHHPKLHLSHDTSELHPKPLQMADAKQIASASGEPGDKTGDETAQSEEGTGRSGEGKAHGKGSGKDKSKDRAEKSLASAETEESEAAQAEKRLEEKLKSGKLLTAGQKKQLAHQMLALAQLRSQTAHSNPALQSLVNKFGQSSQQSEPHKGMSVVTHPSTPSKNGHVGDRGDSVSPKMIRYPKATLDLGTVHMTRPNHGVTGGGSADLRNVSIKVHYVVDDPNNKPKRLLPDKLLHKFPSNCNGDPGNTSKCLATGGNTRLGGTTLHGKHDQISGVKYCVPGAGGIPSAGSSGTQDGKTAATGQIPPKAYHGHAPTSGAAAGGGKSTPNHQDEVLATVINAVHLPAAHGDFHLLIPGAEVPKEDRKWVDNPKAHTDAAPPGVKLAALPRFHVSPRTVGSLSKFGTLNWGQPVKVQHKKAPYGGDGTGLLGMYYHGNGFNQLAFTRPDRNIDFDWSAGPPDPRIAPATEYSVRWLGEIVPKITENYTLMLASDDGARLYLDGRLKIANWTIHSASEDTVTVRLEAGRRYSLKLEYYENALPPAVMKLYWEAPSVPREYVPEDCLRYPKMGAAQ